MWAVLRLLHGFKRSEYGTLPEARRLLRLQAVAMLFVLAAIVTLAYCTRLWWIEVPAWIIALLGLYKLFWSMQKIRSRERVA